MSTIQAYRVTADDLRDVDRGTREGFRPLLSRLNIVLQRVIQLVTTPTDVITDVAYFSTNELGSAYVDISNPLPSPIKPSCVQVAQIFRSDSYPIDNLYGFWWTPTANGIRMLFVGLDPNLTYAFSVRVQ